jgi:diguanylate cyclase (GGDEF)-like protein
LSKILKIQYKAAIIVTLFGSLIVFILSYGFDVKNHTIAIDNELKNIQNISEEVSFHLQTHIHEKTSIAKTITTAPCVKKALRESNSKFSLLNNEKREIKINSLNQQWSQTNNINDPFIQSYMTNFVATYLKSQQITIPEMYGEIFLTNRYGVLVGTTGKLTTLSHAHKYWWRASYNDGKGKIFLDDRGFDESVAGYVLGVVIPIKDKDEIIGILKCNINIAGPLTHSIEEYNDRYFGKLKIVRTGGLVVREINASPLSTQVSESILAELQKKRTSTAIISEKDGNQLMATVPIPITMGSYKIGFGGSNASIDHIKGNIGEGWHVVISVPEEKALESAHETTRFILLASSIITIIASTFAFFLGKLLTSPIVILAKEATRIGHGNLQTRSKISSNDEIGSLAKAINEMAENLERVLVSRDELQKEINQRIEAEKKLQILATTDELTGAYNRRAFYELIKKSIYRAKRHNEPLSLVLLDIDYFKKVNDTYGHNTGDKILQLLVELVLENIRQEDVLARWGGEEFIIALPQTPYKLGIELAERLRNNIATYNFPEVGSMTVSLGLAEFQPKNDDIQSFIKRADNALYKAKDNGRNMVVFF